MVMWSMGRGSVAKDRSQNRDCYYPNCRKDAQCNCTMCMASIHATLDLRPPNNLFSSITNWSETPSRGFASPPSVGGGKENQWPGSEQSKNWVSTESRKEHKRVPKPAFDSAVKSGAELFLSDATEEPVPKKEIRIHDNEKRWFSMKFAVVFVVLVVEIAVPWCLAGVFRPVLSAEKVMGIAGESMVRNRLSDRLDFIAHKMTKVVPGHVVNCTGSDSVWRLEQDGLMLHSRCILYSSLVEEVALWGCPTQTAGVIGRGIVDRSFIIMSGRMIEWHEGKMDCVVHQQGDSWTHAKWAASVVQIDGKTWILEYKPSAIVQGGGLVSRAVHFLMWLICRIYEKVKLKFQSFLLPTFNVRHFDGDFRAPT